MLQILQKSKAKKMKNPLLKSITLIGLLAITSACTTSDRLANIGKAPTLTAISNPTAQAGYRPVTMPMPEVEAVSYQPNSLFRSNAKGFFKDQRAHRVGDILTVIVTISDKAQIANKTNRTRSSTNSAGLGGLFGAAISSIAPSIPVATAIDTNSGISDTGNGSVNRSEKLSTRVAAVVTQILPNGNLVIEGSQEVRVNFEVRELVVAGIIRPEDVGADNTIISSKIAEARIAYGGRGQITDVQQSRYGSQVLDAILPF
jgi:flagellar L-ring protein precursor FlgH